MAGFWCLTDTNLQTEISRELYHKEWNNNTIGEAEVIVLLELLQVLERKGHHINQGIVKIRFDNRVNHRKIVQDISRCRS